MSRRRQPGGGAAGWLRRIGRDPAQGGAERGSFTAEFAAGLPALMMLMLAGLVAIGAVTTKGQCLDAARAAALAEARGEPGGPVVDRTAPGGTVHDVAAGTETITVTLESPVQALEETVPMVRVTCSATAAREPSATGSIP